MMGSWYKSLSQPYEYETTQELVWDIGFKGNKNREVVPAGTPFNVSIPWYLCWLFDRGNSRYFFAAALHDYLLKIGYDRVSAAGAFNHGLKKYKVPYLTRLFMTLAVALFKFS